MVSATNSPLLSVLTESQQSFLSEFLLCALWFEVASDIGERFGDCGSILVGGGPFSLAEFADWRDDIAGDGMAANDGPPQLGGEPGSYQKADIPVHGIEG